MSYAHSVIAAREREENEAADREMRFERRQEAFYRDDCEEYDAMFWLDFADDGECKFGGLYGLFEAKTPEEAWAALKEWKARAAYHYAEHMQAVER